MSECFVCLSPMLLSVVSLAEGGASADEISTATGLDTLAIEKHFAECCTSTDSLSGPDSMDASDERLRRLSERISLAANISGIQGDTKSHLSALSLALRVELEQRQAIADRLVAKRAAPANDADLYQLTVRGADLVLKKALAEATPDSSIWDYKWLMDLDRRALVLFKKIAASPALLAAAQELENAKETQNATANN
jgi:hypothetical protein